MAARLPILRQLQHYQSLILNDGYWRAGYPPPQTLTHTMFSALSQGGYGIEKSSWFWAFPNKTSESTATDYKLRPRDNSL